MFNLLLLISVYAIIKTELTSPQLGNKVIQESYSKNRKSKDPFDDKGHFKLELYFDPIWQNEYTKGNLIANLRSLLEEHDLIEELIFKEKMNHDSCNDHDLMIIKTLPEKDLFAFRDREIQLIQIVRHLNQIYENKFKRHGFYICSQNVLSTWSFGEDMAGPWIKISYMEEPVHFSPNLLPDDYIPKQLRSFANYLKVTSPTINCEMTYNSGKIDIIASTSITEPIMNSTTANTTKIVVSNSTGA